MFFVEGLNFRDIIGDCFFVLCILIYFFFGMLLIFDILDELSFV